MILCFIVVLQVALLIPFRTWGMILQRTAPRLQLWAKNANLIVYIWQGRSSHHQSHLIGIQCVPGTTMAWQVLLQPQRSQASVQQKPRHHLWMAPFHQENTLVNFLWATPVIWRQNGLRKTNRGFTSLSEHCQVACGSLDESVSGKISPFSFQKLSNQPENQPWHASLYPTQPREVQRDACEVVVGGEPS